LAIASSFECNSFWRRPPVEKTVGKTVGPFFAFFLLYVGNVLYVVYDLYGATHGEGEEISTGLNGALDARRESK